MKVSNTIDERNSSRASMTQIVLLTFLGGLLRFYRLGFHSLWLDEVVTVRDASHSLREIPNVIASYPPIWAYITHFFYFGFGHSDFWLRAPAALFGVLTVPLAYWVSKQFYGDRAAFWAGLLMAVSVFDVLYSQEVRMYTLLALEALLSMYVWTRAIETRERRYWFWFGFVTLAGLYTHNWFPFLVLTQGVWWFVVSLRRRLLETWAIAVFLGIVLLYIPWLFVLKKQLALPVYGHMSAPGWSAIRETFYAFAGIRVPSGDSWVGAGADARGPLLVASLGFLLWGLCFQDENRQRAVRTFFVGCFLPVSVAFVISVFIKPIYLPGRYPIMGLPVYILTVARGFQGTSRRWRKRTVWLGSLWVLASLYTLGRYYWNYEKSPWKETCQWISQQAPSPDPLSLILYPDYSSYFIDYYLATRRVNIHPPLESAKNEPVFIVLLDSRQTFQNHMIPASFRILDEAHFSHFRIYKVARS